MAELFGFDVFAKMGGQPFVVANTDIGKVRSVNGKPVYIDVLREPLRGVKAVLIVEPDGKYTVAVHGQSTQYGTVLIEMFHIPPPKKVIGADEFSEAEQMELSEAFNAVRETAEKVIVFDDPRYYDLLVAWEAYTWLRGLFPKNVNLYITGFPGTGKSMVLNHIKRFARYPTAYEPGADKSFKWMISTTLATLLIDEGEYLTRSSVAKLRKYHETNVTESRFMGVPMMGLTLVDIRVDAPIALAATHVPKDIAFLQRGIIIRMKKRHPKVKDLELLTGIEALRLSFVKTLLLNWFKVYQKIAEIAEELVERAEDERIKDIALPFAVMLSLVGRDWRWVIDYAKRSFREAFFVSPESMVFAMFIAMARDRAAKTETHYVIPYPLAKRIIDDLAERLNAKRNDLQYLMQYLYAGCEIRIANGVPSFVCDKATIDSVVESMGEVNIDVATVAEEAEAVAVAPVEKKDGAEDSPAP